MTSTSFVSLEVSDRGWLGMCVLKGEGWTIVSGLIRERRGVLHLSTRMIPRTKRGREVGQVNDDHQTVTFWNAWRFRPSAAESRLPDELVPGC
jgi:hypothetical protein